MKIQITGLVLLSLLSLPIGSFAGSLTGIQAHIEGEVSLGDLFGGPPITDAFSADAGTGALPLAADAFADSIIPSNASVMAVVENDAISVASETNNLSGIELATTSATATLGGSIGAGQWLLRVTTEHVTLLSGIDLEVDAEIAYRVTGTTGVLVDETRTLSGVSDVFDTVEHGFSVASGETAALEASIVVSTASPSFGDAVALSVAEFDLEAAADTDSDGLIDIEDNCTLVSNPGQQDSDGDGIGNACDADLNNDCWVDLDDVAQMRVVFFSNDPDADFNSDGIVNFRDLRTLKASFLQPPGPSGVPNDCD